MSTTLLTTLEVEGLEHWRALCPTLHVEDGIGRPAFAIGDLDGLVGQLRVEGYVNVPGVVEKSVFEPLRDCIATLHRAGIPLAFAFVYDEFWHAFQGASRFVEAALGKDYLALPDFWVWHLTPSEEAAGFRPHRDRARPTFDPDDSPHSLTVWLPFSDATPLNGCIYVLPAQHDERFRRRVWDGPGNAQVENLQDIRALPAQAGSFLAWNQAILHWGGRASGRAEGPRTSAAFEFQRGDKPPINEPLLDPQRVPSFAERLGLIAKQVLQYRHMYPVAPDVECLAIELRDRFMPHVVSAVSPISPSIEPERPPHLPSNNRLPEQAAPLSLMTPNPLAAEPSKPRSIDPKLLRESKATVPEALRSQVIAYTCSQNCMGFRGNVGGCCTLDDRDWIIGPVSDVDVDAFLVDLGRLLGREVSREEVFIDFEEGRALFAERSEWQKPANYPAMRVRPDVARIPCQFYESSTGACTVHDIRPGICREYLCGHLKDVISLLNLSEE